MGKRIGWGWMYVYYWRSGGVERNCCGVNFLYLGRDGLGNSLGLGMWCIGKREKCFWSSWILL